MGSTDSAYNSLDSRAGRALGSSFSALHAQYQLPTFRLYARVGLYFLFQGSK